MASNKKRAEKVYNLWQTYADSPIRQKWETIAEEDEQFYHGFQWTNTQYTALKAGGMHPVVRNRIKPAVDQKIALLTANLPKGKITFVNGDDDQAAMLLNGVLKHVYYVSEWHNQTHRVASQVENSGGISWLMPTIDELSSDGLGDIKIRWINNKYVYVSPNVTEIPSLDDASEVFIAKPVPLQWAINNKPNGVTEKDLKNAEDWYKRWGSSQKNAENDTLDIGVIEDGMGIDNDVHETVLKIEKYEVLQRQLYLVTNEAAGTQYEATEDEIKEISKLDIFLNKISYVPTRKVRRVKVTHIYGPSVWVGEEWLDLDRFPMVPFINNDTMNLFPRDDVYYARDEQVVLNKTFSQGLQATQVSMTPKLIINKGTASDDDKKEIKKKWGQTNALIELEFTPEGTPQFQVVPPQTQNNPFWTQAGIIESGINYNLGINLQDMGDPSQSPETYSATMQIRNWGMQKLRPILNSWNTSLQRLLDNVVQLIPGVYDSKRVIAYFDDEYMDDLVTKQLNIPQFVDGIWTKVNNVGDLRGSYRIVWDSFIPQTNREMMVNMFGELFRNSGGNMIFFEEMIKYMDIVNRKQLAQKIGLVNQLRAQVDQLGTELRDRDIDLDRSRREEVNAKQAAILANFRAKYAIDFNKTKEQRKYSTKEFKDDLDSTLNEMIVQFEKDLEVRKVEHDAKMDVIEAKAERNDG